MDHLLNWGSLFSENSSLHQVDKANQLTHRKKDTMVFVRKEVHVECNEIGLAC